MTAPDSPGAAFAAGGLGVKEGRRRPTTASLAVACGGRQAEPGLDWTTNGQPGHSGGVEPPCELEGPSFHFGLLLEALRAVAGEWASQPVLTLGEYRQKNSYITITLKLQSHEKLLVRRHEIM